MNSETLALLLGLLGPILLVIGVFTPIILWLGIVAAVRLAEGAFEPGGGRAHRGLRLVAGGLAFFAAVIGGLLLIVTLLAALHVFGFLVLVALAFLTVEIVVRTWATKRYTLLWMLTVAAERLMPLAPAVEAFGRECGGLFGRRARRLAEALEAGMPLPDALRRYSGLVPHEAVPLIRVGYETGTLAPALRHACVTRNTFEPLRYALMAKLGYLAWLFCFALGVVTFVMLKIVPAFQKIFDDFETELPAMTQLLIFAADVAAPFVALVAFLMVPMLLLALVFCYFGLGRWRLPGLHFVVDQLDAAAVLDSLSLVARQGRPILDAVATLARTHPRSRIRHRMDHVRQDIETGVDWCESLCRRRMIGQADMAVLQAAARVGNVDWALGEMADSVRRRLGYRFNAILQIVFPIVIVGFGLGVMFIVVALFMPLIKLIAGLT